MSRSYWKQRDIECDDAAWNADYFKSGSCVVAHFSKPANLCHRVAQLMISEICHEAGRFICRLQTVQRRERLRSISAQAGDQQQVGDHLLSSPLPA